MDHDSSDDEPRLPPNVLTAQRRGWAGENLEIEHQRQSLNEEKKSHTATAVDLSQFRNEEVGRGYQAKHVVRQRETAVSSSIGMVDMSGGAFERGEKKSKSEKKKEKKRKRGRDDSDKVGDDRKKDSRLDSYLKCRGLEMFLGEIESLLSR